MYLCVWVFSIVESSVYLFVALKCLTQVDVIFNEVCCSVQTHTDSLIQGFRTVDEQQVKHELQIPVRTIIVGPFWFCKRSRQPNL